MQTKLRNPGQKIEFNENVIEILEHWKTAKAFEYELFLLLILTHCFHENMNIDEILNNVSRFRRRYIY